jgi:predicted alpha/beta-hydrolase family hydrolase
MSGCECKPDAKGERDSAKHQVKAQPSRNWIAAKPDSWNGDTAIILAHGAGQGMQSPFMNYFHTELAARGFLTVKFNFDYIDQKRKIPDPQPKLQARYRTVVGDVVAAHRPRRVIIGGKSLGGRVASYIAAATTEAHGLVFLGYPLHPPGKHDQLRDQHLYAIPVPMLFLSGTKDAFAERTLLEDVVRKIGERATLVWIEGGDHSLKTARADKDSLPMAVDRIEEWILRTNPRRLL